MHKLHESYLKRSNDFIVKITEETQEINTEILPTFFKILTQLQKPDFYM